VLIESINRTLSSVPSGTRIVVGILALGALAGAEAEEAILGAVAFLASAGRAFSGWSVVAVASSAESLAQLLKTKVKAIVNTMHKSLFIDNFSSWNDWRDFRDRLIR